MGNWIDISTQVRVWSGEIVVTARLDRTTLDLEHIALTAKTSRLLLEGHDLDMIIAARDELKDLAARVQNREKVGV